MTKYNSIPSFQFGHQFDQKSRKLDACIHDLNMAYQQAKDLDLPELMKAIDFALNIASIEGVHADEEYNNRD